MLTASLSPWLPTAISKMVVFRIDRNYPSYVILISVPLGRVSEALPGFMPPSVAGAYSMGAFFLGIGLAFVNQYGECDAHLIPYISTQLLL